MPQCICTVFWSFPSQHGAAVRRGCPGRDMLADGTQIQARLSIAQAKRAEAAQQLKEVRASVEEERASRRETVRQSDAEWIHAIFPILRVLFSLPTVGGASCQTRQARLAQAASSNSADRTQRIRHVRPYQGRRDEARCYSGSGSCYPMDG